MKRLRIGFLAAGLFALGGYSIAGAEPGAGRLLLAQLEDGFDADSFDPGARYAAACFACHSTGAAGAPRVAPGNAEEWAPRLEKGFDVLVENTVNGIGTMPPKGLCFDCTPEQLRAIVEYMLAASE